MIKGIHAMFCSAGPADPRALLRDVFCLPCTAVGVPGGLAVTLYQPRCRKG